MGISFAVVLPIIIIVAICVGVAGLVLTIGKWKEKMGLLPKFKSPTVPRHHQRGGISKYSDRPS